MVDFVVATLCEVFMLSWSHRSVICVKKGITGIAAQFRYHEVVEWWDFGIQQEVPKKQPLTVNVGIMDGVGSHCRVKLGTLTKSVPASGHLKDFLLVMQLRLATT